MKNYIFKLDANKFKISDIDDINVNHKIKDKNEKEIIEKNIIEYSVFYNKTTKVDITSFYNLFVNNNNKLSFKIKNINSNNISFNDIDNINVKNLIYNYSKVNKYTFWLDFNDIILSLTFPQNNHYIFNNKYCDKGNISHTIDINLNFLTLIKNQKKLYFKEINEIKEILKNTNILFDFDVDIILVSSEDKNNNNYCKRNDIFKLLLRKIYIYEIKNNKQIEIKNKIIKLINENKELKDEINILKNENNELKNKNDKSLKELKDEINNLKNNDNFINDIDKLLNK